MSPSAQPSSKGLGDPIQRYLAGVVACVSPDASLREVATKLMAVEVGALVVGSTDEVQGMISERDVVRCVGLGRDPKAVAASEVARPDLVWCPPTATVGEVGRIMVTQGVRHVLIGEHGRLVGIASARDVLAAGAAT